jgi:3-isopropylmalate dehydratase small subunit
MSEFAFFRFMSNRMLTREEEQHKNEIIQLTEEVLDAKGLECDSRIAKISEDQLREILAEVRKLRKKRKKANDGIGVVEETDDEGKEPEQKEEPPYIK